MPFPLSARVSLAALLGLVIALPVVSAGPPKPAAKPATAAPLGSTLAAVEEACDKIEKDSNTALRRKRYEQVAAYVKANGTAKDIEDARATAMNLAEELEDWANTVAHADDYLKSHAEGADQMDVRLTRASALGKLARIDDAKKAYDETIQLLDLEKHGPNALWIAYSGYATLLADSGDVEGAKKQYQAAKDAMPNIPQVNGLAEGAIKDLELVGTEPTAFPEGAKDLDGKALSLADFKGKVLLIDFWATWCGPCVREMPNVVKQYEKFHAKGFEIMAISLDNEGADEKVKAFTKEHAMPWRQYFDGKGWKNEIAVLYEIHSIPRTILVGKDGKIIKAGLHGEALAKAVEKAMAAK